MQTSEYLKNSHCKHIANVKEPPLDHDFDLSSWKPIKKTRPSSATSSCARSHVPSANDETPDLT